MAEKKRLPKGEAANRLEALGIAAICERIIAGVTERSIAADAGVSVATFSEWIAKDNERSARAREARKQSAHQFAEKAEEEIRNAADPFELSKAKELAHHWRWRASKANPKEFGDKLAIGGADDLPPIKTLTDDQLEARIKALENGQT